MTFYQELQLSSVGSKQLIKNTTDPKEKRRHILIYNFKVYLVMAFCVAVVSLYSKLTGSNNSVVGVTVLLAVLVLRQADFGIRTTHGLFCIAGIYGILMAGPRIANSVSAVPAFAVNIICIMLLMILGCHNVIMYNHSTFVLGYLLLLGYDVTGAEYIKRVEGLAVGMLLCMFIFYKNQKNRPYRRTFLDLFREFDLNSARGRWYLKLTLIVSSAMLFHEPSGTSESNVGRNCLHVCMSSIYRRLHGTRRKTRNVQHCRMCFIHRIIPDPSEIHVSVYRHDRWNWRRLFSRICLADCIQYFRSIIHRSRTVRHAGSSSTSYRCQCIRSNIYDPM